jgi:hypothetical protein
MCVAIYLSYGQIRYDRIRYRIFLIGGYQYLATRSFHSKLSRTGNYRCGSASALGGLGASPNVVRTADEDYNINSDRFPNEDSTSNP